MEETWKKGRYQIEQVFSEQPPKKEDLSGIWYYIVKDRERKQKCFLSRIRGRELIDQCLPNFFELDQKGLEKELVDCFSEQSEVFLVFLHYEMPSLRQYLSKTILDRKERLSIFCDILKKMLSYKEIPIILQSGMWDCDFIRIEQGEIRFDFKADLENLPHQKIKLLEVLFSPQERKEDREIWLLIERIQKNVKASTEELLEEAEQILQKEMDKKEKRKRNIRTGKQRLLLIGKIVTGIVLMTGILLTIRYFLFEAKPEEENTENIPAVGTVPLDQMEQ